MNASPIFLHSMFRSGSTYLANTFRRTPGNWCYQEPFHEHLRFIDEDPARLLAVHAEGEQLRHPRMENPYFWEFHEVGPELRRLFRKEFSYDAWFAAPGDPSFEPQRVYLETLVRVARGRPVFKCCRTAGRVAAIRDALGGMHVHLWRNPWDQWWSYKNSDYFDATTALILNAWAVPAVLLEIRDACRIATWHDSDVEREAIRAMAHRLPPEEAYLAFYALWLYAFIATEDAAQLSVSIDALSSSSSYREAVLQAFAEHNIGGLDFSDCSVPQSVFQERERHAFAAAEERVHDIFRRHGYAAQVLAAVAEARQRHAPGAAAGLVAVQGEVARMRDLATRYARTIADAQQRLEERDRHLEEASAARQAMAAEADAAAAQLVEQARELEGAQERLREQEGMLAEARARLAQLDHELHESAAAHRAAQDALSAAVSRQGMLEEVLRGARARIEALGGELGVANDTLVTLRADLEASRAREASLLAEVADTGERTRALAAQLVAATGRAEEQGRQSHHWWTVADGLTREIRELRASWSWHITAPLRRLHELGADAFALARCGPARGAGLARHAAHRVLLATVTQLRSRPRAKLLAARGLRRFPRLEARLRAFVSPQHGEGSVAEAQHGGMVEGSVWPQGVAHGRTAVLSPSARRVHRELLRARDSVATSADAATAPRERA